MHPSDVAGIKFWIRYPADNRIFSECSENIPQKIGTFWEHSREYSENIVFSPFLRIFARMFWEHSQNLLPECSKNIPENILRILFFYPFLEYSLECSENIQRRTFTELIGWMFQEHSGCPDKYDQKFSVETPVNQFYFLLISTDIS